jgi:1L-myo-inositol 1-phosphate cytidylyltransferase / CDP-L-myo-inositol myo-inositolphosphotransferase
MSEEAQSILAPLFVIDARSIAMDSIDPTVRLLGLTLLERLVLAARKAGFADISVWTDEGRVQGCQKLLKGHRDVSVNSSLPVTSERPTLRVPVSLLGEVPWLAECRHIAENLSESQDLGHGVHVFCKKQPIEDAPSENRRSLTNEPLHLAEENDLKHAETRLMKSLWKTTDGVMSRYVARPISLRVSRLLAPLGVTPNQMTVVSMLIGLAAAPFFLVSDPKIQVIGGLLFAAHSILDGCDGELARLTYRESRFGGLLDFFSDNLVHIAVFACMAFGWSAQVSATWPLYFGAGAVFGTAGSAYAVYWLTLRNKGQSGPVYTSVSAGPSRQLTKILDELSRRDFIYLVLALSAFGLAQWFVAGAGIGAPIFCIMVVIAARADSAEKASSAA